MMNTKKTYLYLLVTLCLLVLSVAAQGRTWTLNDNTTVKGEFYKIRKEFLLLKQEDAKFAKVPLKHLTKKDRTRALNAAVIFEDNPPDPMETDVSLVVPSPRIKATTKKEPTSELVTLKPNTPAQPPKKVAEPTEQEKLDALPLEFFTTQDEQSEPAPEPAPAPEPTPRIDLSDSEPSANRPDPRSNQGQPIVLAIQQKEKTLSEIIMAPRQFLNSYQGRLARKAVFAALSDSNNRILAASVLMLAFAAIMSQRRKRIYPNKVAPRKRRGKKTTDNEKPVDDEDKFKPCPFCGLTNENTTDQCKHCGQDLK
jgi:hypothetical protein